MFSGHGYMDFFLEILTLAYKSPFSDFTEEITTVADSGAETIFTDLEIIVTLLLLSLYLYVRL